MSNSTIIHVPHASTLIPNEYKDSFDQRKIHREVDVMTDWFCDELFPKERSQLVFPISRLVCDVERFRDDEREMMAKVGMGMVYTQCSDLSPLRTVTEREKEQIVKKYYDWHHQKLTMMVENKIKTFGKCLLIDAHSFYPTPLPYECNQDEDRPDFCIGTSSFHTSREMVDAITAFLTSRGFSVKENEPFAGTLVPMKFYEKEKRVRSIMIEVNRRLYLASPSNKNLYFEQLKEVLQECVQQLEIVE